MVRLLFQPCQLRGFAPLYLIMGGWLGPELKKVGTNAPCCSQGRVGDQSHMVAAIESDMLDFSCDFEEMVRSNHTSKPKRRAVRECWD